MIWFTIDTASNELCHWNVNMQVIYGAGFVEYYAEEGKRVYGDIIPSPFPTKRMLVMKQVRLTYRLQLYYYYYIVLDFCSRTFSTFSIIGPWKFRFFATQRKKYELY